MSPKKRVKSDARHVHAAASDLLEQLLPGRMLRDVCDLALKFERDEAFRDHVVARRWAIAAVVCVFVLVSSVCAIAVMVYAVRTVPSPVPLWLRAFALLLGATVWLGGVAAQVYVFLIWLEQRAASGPASPRGLRVPGGVLAYLKYRRALPPWILVALCVVVPIALLGLYAPLTALLLVGAGVLAPVLFDQLDS